MGKKALRRVARWFMSSFACTVLIAGWSLADEPVAVRVENFTVPPATGPLAFVAVKNLRDTTYTGSVSLSAPEGWRIVPTERAIQLEAGQTSRVAFNVEQARTTLANTYVCEARAIGGGATVVHRRTVAVTSAPYFKPTIDGDPSDWKDAIPVNFETNGKKTAVSTFWSRRSFSLLVEVQEDHLAGGVPTTGSDPVDAVQFALARADAKTPTSADQVAERFEFLLIAGGGDGEATCFRLAEPGTPIKATQQPRPLASLKYDEASVAAKRHEGITYYECSLPFKPMRDQIRPSEGREFRFGLLVHDPNGVDIRDMGQAAGLWAWQRNRLAWSRWPGATWLEQPPFDGKLCWGMCSSKY